MSPRRSPHSRFGGGSRVPQARILTAERTVRAQQRKIAALTHVEAALRESEERFRRLADNAPDLIYRFDYLPERHFAYVSTAVTAITGYLPEDYYADPDLGWRQLHTDDLPRFQQYLTDLEHLRHPVEMRWIHRSGAVIWVEQRNVPIFDDAGRLMAIEGIVRDISERKRVSEALRTSETRLHLLLANTPAVIFSSRTEGDFGTTFISDTIRNILGYEPAQFLSYSNFWKDCIHPEDTAGLLADVPLLYKHGWRKYEYRCRHADGSYRWIENGVSLLPTVAGHPAEVIGYMLDITERKQAEEALQHANLGLAHAARMKDEFLANMSHELRTPLNAILGRAELLHERLYGTLTAKQDQAITSIAESGQHLLTLINDILDLSKVEAGKLTIEPGEVDVELCCQQSVHLVSESATRSRLKLAIDLDPQVRVIQADVRRIKQILVNLLSNAVKFTPAGGQVGLEVQGDAERQAVTFTVWDTGIGIAPQDQGRLFKPFVQIDSSLSRQHAGTGLGLALVLRLAELHGGSVALESTPGAGSRFSVTLPWAPMEAWRRTRTQVWGTAEGPLRMAGTIGAAGRPLILLADDHEENIQLLSDVLTEAGYFVEVARNGVEAVRLAEEVRPALVLMDVQMPVLDGLEASRRLRAGHLPNTPIIALTALAMAGDRERCLEAGVNAYLTKPVGLRALLATIAELLTGCSDA